MSTKNIQASPLVKVFFSSLVAVGLQWAATGVMAQTSSTTATTSPAVQLKVYPKTNGPDKNPMKGWSSAWDNNYAEASIGFQYIPWKDFEPTDGQFSKTAVENIIKKSGTAGRHVVLRLYCDWDGIQPTACPTWMKGKGVPVLKSDDGKLFYDYNNATYLAQAEAAIAKLAELYDNDARVFAIEMGVLGLWGEWHTADVKVAGRQYVISDASKNRILSAYQTNFKRAEIMGRYPQDKVPGQTTNIGFHNDFFIAGNAHSKDFENSIRDGKKWLQAPIGGETPPRTTQELSTELPLLFGTATGTTMFSDGHYSFMAPAEYRRVAGQKYYAEYMAMHKRMGYNFQINYASFAPSLLSTQPFEIRLGMANIGLAPMYFAWVFEFALLRSDDSVALPFNSSFDPRTLKDAGTGVVVAGFAANRAARGSYRLAVRLTQRQANTPQAAQWGLDARNAYVQFSNSLVVVPAKWDTNAGLIGGWSVLGDVTVK